MFVKTSGATLALLFALFVSCTQGSLASTITVVPSEAQTQIQASINNSHSGDTISFQAGTYNLNNLTLQPGRIDSSWDGWLPCDEIHRQRTDHSAPDFRWRRHPLLAGRLRRDGRVQHL